MSPFNLFRSLNAIRIHDFAALARRPEVKSLARWNLLFGELQGKPGGTLFGPSDPDSDPSPFPALDRAPATDPHGFTMPVAAHALPITAQVTVPAQYQPPQLGGPMPTHVPAHIAARAEAEQANAAAMLEASSRLLSSFSAVLKSFGQLPAQLATLTVALVLFIGATILSLH